MEIGQQIYGSNCHLAMIIRIGIEFCIGQLVNCKPITNKFEVVIYTLFSGVLKCSLGVNFNWVLWLIMDRSNLEVCLLVI